MPSYLDFLPTFRQRRLFAPPEQIDEGRFLSPRVRDSFNFLYDDEDDLEERSSRTSLVKPPEEDEYEDSPTLKSYREHIAGMPTRDDYKPNLLTKIVASIGGASSGYFGGPDAGIATARNILDLPYKQKLEEYTTKENSLKRILDAEAAMGRLKVQKQRANTYDKNADTRQTQVTADIEHKSRTFRLTENDNARKLAQTSALIKKWEKENSTKFVEAGVAADGSPVFVNTKDPTDTRIVRGTTANEWLTHKDRQASIATTQRGQDITKRGQDMNFLLGKERNDLAEDRLNQEERVRPRDQVIAEQSALRELQGESKFSSWIEPDPNDKTVLRVKPTAPASVKAEFAKELKRRSDEMLNKTYSPKDFELEQDDWEIL